MNPSNVQSEILVCQAGSCRAAGSEAVLLEIEELAAAVSSQCKVRESGCLSMCSQAPSAVVILHDPPREREHSRLRTVEASARVVEVATGIYPPLDDGRVKERLQEARRKRARDYAIASSKWNAALKVFSTGGVGRRRVDKNVFETEWQRAELLGNVGMWDAAVDVLAMLEEQLRERYSEESGANMTWYGLLQVAGAKVKCLGKRGRCEDIERTDKEFAEDLQRLGGEGRLGPQGEHHLRAFRGAVAAARRESDDAMESGNRQQIENYSQWTLQKITPVSEHSAIFHFTSTDRKRGTPHPRGAGKVASPVTWHTTLLAFVGENKEGPLPWIERDYTPISSGKQWERGFCDILIKLYPDGAATSWLREVFCQGNTSGLPGGASEGQKPQLWLSKPHKTLSVPSLADETNGLSGPLFRPLSVLLILAGTGVVAVPQILAHRDPYGQLGIPTKASDQLHVPIDLLLSCRAGDVLMLPEIVEWCAEAQKDPRGRKGLRHCSLLLTETGGIEEQPRGPFSGGPLGFDAESFQRELTKFCELPNCCLVKGRRVDAAMVSDAVAKMPQPLRVVVSGPEGFNKVIREMLLAASVEPSEITMLTA